MKKTFLYRVWQHDRRLFFALSGLGIATLFFNLLGTQLTPFFIWGMYSEKEQPVVRYEIMQTTVNDSLVIDHSAGKPVNTLFYLQSPLSHYKRILDNNGIDPTISWLQQKLGSRYSWVQPWESTLFNTPAQQAAFWPWYQRYLQQVTGVPVNSIAVDVVQVHYGDAQQPIVDSIYSFQRWQP